MVTATRKRVDIPIVEAILRKYRVAVKDKVVEELKRLPVRQKAPPAPKGGIGINQAARKYGLHPRTISRWAAQGKVPIIARTKNWLYVDESALIIFCERNSKIGTKA
jgi:hypothetical protein